MVALWQGRPKGFDEVLLSEKGNHLQLVPEAVAKQPTAWERSSRYITKYIHSDSCGSTRVEPGQRDVSRRHYSCQVCHVVTAFTVAGFW